jgi:cytochrome c oxidase cbb3-type subunit 3
MENCKLFKSSSTAIALLIVFLLNSGRLKAEDIATEPLLAPLSGNLFKPELYFASLIILLLLVSVFVLSYALNKVTKYLLNEAPGVETVKEEQKISAFQKVLNSATIPNEEDVLLDHNYDGIMELDNDMPPWWVKLFYVTVITAVIYMFHYHVFKTGKLQGDEYASELKVAEEQKEAFRKLAANNIDETTVTQLMVTAELEEGKSLFVAKCSPCHGKNAEGIVGPNLTDEYWLHGGGIKNVFKSIKFGIPQKGMIAWETQLKPTDIQKVASYILSIQGSHPANAKAPQGEIDKEENSLPADSLQASKK